MRIAGSWWLALFVSAVFLAIPWPAPPAETGNLIEDPSFEIPRDPNQFGHVFAKWGGWNYQGDCKFGVGEVAHTGKTSALLECHSDGKIRIEQLQNLEAGRYRVTAYIRGLDVGIGLDKQTTEFMFNGRYIPLHQAGSFGWTRLTYVADVAKPGQAGPSFGLFAAGMLWVDDVSMAKVGNDVPPTDVPVLGVEEAPIAPPGPVGAGEIRCSRCRRRNMPQWEKCYACGAPLVTAAASALPVVKPITSFEKGNPFNAGSVVPMHAADGARALRIDRALVVMEAAQNWAGYEFLKADVYTDSPDPLPVNLEIWDAATKDYWSRVNYSTVAPPGASTLTIPLKLLFVGEKSRPGRRLQLAQITRLVFGISGNPPAPLFLDNLRVERDSTRAQAFFPGLDAFDFGPANSPVMDGFLQVTPATSYNPSFGYGLRNAVLWRAMDVLEPDPLYQDFITIESGSFVVDLPNGTYRVFVNLDSPAGFWGEPQLYHRRAILAQGKPVAVDNLDFESFQKKYFRFWDTEDLPSDNTFDKYQRAFFAEKTFDVEVKNGQLDLGFQGQNWACAVSAVIVFPVEKAAEGARFLEWVRERRRFYFDNSFKRVLHRAAPATVHPTGDDVRRGYQVFHRDFMKDVYYNDTPAADELGQTLSADGFAGQNLPVTLSVRPLEDLGKATLTVSPLAGPSGVIPASAVETGYVSYRITRVTLDGSVYTLKPRLILPLASVAMPKEVTRRFWLTVHLPAGAAPGVYTGPVTFTPQQGAPLQVPLQVTVRRGTLDALDIAAGPFGYWIGTAWYHDDPKTAAFNKAVTEKGLRTMRAYGFTMFSGIPAIAYKGFKDHQPALDFTSADAQMQMARDLGFLAVSSYGGGVEGFDPYHVDRGKMAEAGFRDYSAFVGAVYGAIERHAEEKKWLPVYWNLGDEPSGDALKDSLANATEYRKAFPSGPPFFTVPTSGYNHGWNDLEFQLAKTLHIATVGPLDEDGLKKLLDAGGSWAFYNSGDRWTYGAYLYKAAKEFHLKYRLAWHWHAAAGNPYYALDSREDDYAWADAAPDGRLVLSVEMMRIAAGLDDYRHMLTLARLAKGKPGEDLVRKRLAAFHLGQRDHDQLFGVDDWAAYRRQLADAIAH